MAHRDGVRSIRLPLLTCEVMEKKMKRTARQIGGMYALLWLSAVAGFVAGEFGQEAWVGLFAGSYRATYVGEAVTILLTIVCVPVALRIFAWALPHRILAGNDVDTLRRYALWSGLRLLLLALPLWSGIAVYYLTTRTTGALCALIVLTASLFCVPSLGRMRSELRLNQSPSE